MNGVSYKVVEVAPSKGVDPEILKQHFAWRKTGEFPLGDTVQAGIMLEPVWWNRPLRSDELSREEEDGLWSYDLPYIYGKPSFKTGYNILINEGSVPVIMHIRLRSGREKTMLEKLRLLPVKAARNALLKLGVDAADLSQSKNDLLFRGKKFMGSEEAVKGGWYASASVITLECAGEADIFKRLTGKYALARGITGVMEETKLFTKERFIEAFFESVQDILDELPQL